MSISSQGGPLSNIVVADFSRVLAGPFAAMTLGDLGAKIIKIEQPGKGDDTRSWGPPWKEEESTYFLGLNRNKRSIALDLKDPADRALASKLALKSDVTIESFRPGLMESWGLDGDTLRLKNPALISSSIVAFGSTPEAAELPGYDLLLQAMGGLMSITGDPDGKPQKVGSAVIDLVCGLFAVVGIQAALQERARTGKGRHVEISLLDSALTSLLNQGSSWVTGEVLPQRLGNRHPSIAPYETYRASDSEFAIAVGNDRLFQRLCETIGLPDLLSDSRFSSNSLRVENIDLLREKLEERFRTATADHWVALLTDNGVPSGSINNVSEAFEVAESLNLSPVQTIDGLKLIGCALKFDGQRPEIARRPPRLDEHRDEIRAWLDDEQDL